MAVMIPSVINGVPDGNREKEVFRSLQKLPDDYYVFHSFKITKVEQQSIIQRELDFVVYNQAKGILVIEVKSGRIRCESGQWKYQNGTDMQDGPYAQADSGKWRLLNCLKRIQSGRFYNISRRCAFYHAVWFPSITDNDLNRINFPQDGLKELTLTKDDLDDPEPFLCNLFSMKVVNDIRTNLSQEDHRYILDNFLCPTFNIVPSPTDEIEDNEKKFNSMLEEQCNLLNYLEYQETAVINGAAGTGKTLMALEKARRHATVGDKVLFLCFNTKLAEHLKKTYAYPNVDFQTIFSFARNETGLQANRMEYFHSMLKKKYKDKSSFPYQHIVIDEGQDIGQSEFHANELFTLFEELTKAKGGTFYIFYDKYQKVQARTLPQYIVDADCKLTLYKNCRNTKQIAITSTSCLAEKPHNKPSDIAGSSPRMTFCNTSDMKDAIDKAISYSFEKETTDIVILSCSAEGQSVIKNLVSSERYQYGLMSIKFTTVRKFKGLEADHIILVDVNKQTITENSLLFYVGSSRAKLHLTVIANMTENECTDALQQLNSIVKDNNPKRSLASFLGCKLV